MKVAVFLQDLSGGGAERVMVQLAGSMADLGVDVDLVLVRLDGPYLEAVSEKVRIVNLAAQRTLKSIFALAHYLKREKPAALLSALVHVNIAALLARRIAGDATRIAISEHNTISMNAADAPTAVIRIAHKLVPWIYPWADEVIAVSQGVGEDLAAFSGLPIDRIRVINNPVITPRLRQLAREPADHPWLARGQPPVILGVGRLAAQKDFATLMNAFAELRQRKMAKLIILGEGPGRPELERLAENLGLRDDVQLPGFVQNPYAFMSNAALLALSSRWEGSPTVLVECMGCGTPVVATDCPSGPNEILEAGRYGPLVPVGDSQALAAAMLATLEAPLPAEILRRKADDFRVEVSAERYLQVLLRRATA